MHQIILTLAIVFFPIISGFTQNQNLEIETGSYITALYRNSGHEITILKPLISEKDNVRYTFEGGMVIPNANDSRVITLVPDLAKVTLKIYRDTILIGEREFGVRLIPKPTIKFYADSNLIENLNPQNEKLSRNTRYLTLKAKPEEAFAVFMPYDARYTVRSWRVMLVRKAKIIDSLSITDETIDVSQLLSKSKSGDRVYMEVFNVIRKNFMNREEEVKLGTVLKMMYLE